MNINESSLQMSLERGGKPGWTTAAKNHWHPCCQEHPDTPMPTFNMIEESVDNLVTFKCPRGHEYEAPEPFIISTPDLACNSGPICIYCYVTWLHVNLGTEELVVRG